MKLNIQEKAAIFPMPVLMIATYNEDGSVDVMNAAWGCMLNMSQIALNLTETHKTVENIKRTGAFTVALADRDHVAEADYFGMVSSYDDPMKFEKSGMHAIKSEVVDAPIIDEFPIVMECKFVEYQDDDLGIGVIGDIVNVQAEEYVLDEEGKVDASKLNALVFNSFKRDYYSIGERVAKAFSEGGKFINK